MLQMSLSSCRDILKRAYNAKTFALQMIHLARGLYHLIITMADKMAEVYAVEAPDIDATLVAGGELADLLYATPSIIDELDM